MELEDATFSLFHHATDPKHAFRDLDIAKDKVPDFTPSEGIIFGSFDSAKEGLWLLERDAPTPSEKAITDSVPYQQGEYDFSLLDGQRYFDVREIEYQFVIFDADYRFRSSTEHEIKRKLIPQGYQELHDSHIPGYVWRAKCSDVSVEDSVEDSTLIATVTFTAYPYALTENDEGADIWDDVNFDHWIFQYVDFDVNGDRDVNIVNIGSAFVQCGFELTGSVKLSNSILGDVELNQNNYQTTQIVLDPGDNRIHLSGNGHIKFVFKREEML